MVYYYRGSMVSFFLNMPAAASEYCTHQILKQPTSGLVISAPCVAKLVLREFVILSGSKPNLEEEKI